MGRAEDNLAGWSAGSGAFVDAILGALAAKQESEAKKRKWDAYAELQREIQMSKNKVDGQQLIDYALSMGMPYEQITKFIRPDGEYNWRLGKEWIDELNTRYKADQGVKKSEIGAEARKAAAQTAADARVQAGREKTGSQKTTDASRLAKQTLANLIAAKGFDPTTSLMTVAGANESNLDDILEAWPTALQGAFEGAGIAERVRPAPPFEVVEKGGWFSQPKIKVLPGFEAIPVTAPAAAPVPTAVPMPVPGPAAPPPPVVAPSPAAVVTPEVVGEDRTKLRKQFRKY